MKTQREEVIERLTKKGSITSMWAWKHHSITRLSSIIYKLRKKGLNIETVLVRKTNWWSGRTVQYAEYFLRGSIEKLPKYWAVKNDGSQLFKDTVIPYVNKGRDKNFSGDAINGFYGYEGGYIGGNGMLVQMSMNGFDHNPTLLSLKKFIELTK